MRTPHLLASACTASDPEARYHQAELAIYDELMASLGRIRQTWLSAEEGATVIGLEVDDPRDEVRGNRIGRSRAEAAQVGAMALRFVADLYQPSGTDDVWYRVAAAEQRAAIAHVGPSGRVLATSHEAFGFLKREYDAPWAAIRFDELARPIAARVAALSVRFIAEITAAPAPAVRAER
ncbi:hypothetical protein [Mycolicibacterium neoaurum]|uniref:hypothetical protein n=1 Tax=Mycolicibacterium neoaurum TaxID=1795 RepID=UPI001F4CE5C7|nr:hypothetical protein [Mycolicibacterium neoaurum]